MTSTLEVVNPYNLKPLATLPMQDEAAALTALKKAHALYEDHTQRLSVHERINILERFSNLIKKNEDILIAVALQEGGKPYSDTKVEIERGIEGAKTAIRELALMHGTEVPMGHTATSTQRMAFTRREPRGVVLAISAFNHPFNLIIHQVIPAVAVGCPVIVKPALTTPISCKNVVDMLHEAGLPKDGCQMMLCENTTAEKMVSDDRIAFLTFIGSAKVGWSLRGKLAAGADCALEHGGCAPVIVDETADIDDCLPLLTKAGYAHAGQVCVSVQRIYLQEKIKESFTQPFVQAVKALKVGDPADNSTQVGPLILPREVERVHTWVEEAIDAGAQRLCGGEKISDTCYAPTVLLNPPDDCRISKEEIFGPVTCLYTYKDRDEAIRRANSVPYAFQAAIFTREIDSAIDTAQRINAVSVMINDHTAFRIDAMPFGGMRHSGLHIGGIGHSMRDMSYEKMTVWRSKYL